ncbi:chaplin family protein [Streptomyces ziwulingensis]|uniref:Chaplin domain-containing protein n=1 Tax=Streptomyces ziwulingensis TaxID=1045501 RepID=A0ABP9CRG9_9ACTN
MGTETRGTGSGAGRTGMRVAVLGAAAGAALLPAGAAHASVIGVGNAVFGNTCVTQGSAGAAGATVAGSGLGTGNAAGLPLSLPRNRCGNSGIVCTALFRSSV